MLGRVQLAERPLKQDDEWFHPPHRGLLFGVAKQAAVQERWFCQDLVGRVAFNWGRCGSLQPE